jgi:RecA/RadA recombinase
MSGRNDKYIPSGLKSIDRLLGGWKRRIITLLIGESGAGKSTLLIASAYHAAKNGFRVNYIDTEGNPVEDVMERLPENARKNVNIERAVKGMESLEDAVRRLGNLPRELLEKSLIIVDSITYHYHALIRTAGTDAERDRLQSRLEAIVYSLHSLAVGNDAAAVASTWPTSIYDPEGDYVGGFAVKTYSRIQLRIYLSMLSNERIIEVVKHQSPRMYKCWEKITLDEIMDLVDMPRPETEKLKKSPLPIEEVGEAGYEPGA